MISQIEENRIAVYKEVADELYDLQRKIREIDKYNYDEDDYYVIGLLVGVKSQVDKMVDEFEKDVIDRLQK